MPRALITGSAGFIGGTLVRHLLARDWEVHAFLGPTCKAEALDKVKDQVRCHFHDGSTQGLFEILDQVKPEVVFHLASLFLSDHQPEDIEALVRSNILLSTQLAEAMACTGAARLVNTGTSWQHYHQADYRPVNLYAATKQAFEDILAYYHDARGLSHITLKLFDTYGPRDPRRKLVNLLLESARSGAVLDLSPGEQVLDLLHVDDVVAAFRVAGERLLASEAPLCETYLLGGTRLTVRKLADCITRATGRPILAQWGGRPYRPREVMAPVASGAALPSWTPGVGLEQGLSEAYSALDRG